MPRTQRQSGCKAWITCTLMYIQTYIIMYPHVHHTHTLSHLYNTLACPPTQVLICIHMLTHIHTHFAHSAHAHILIHSYSYMYPCILIQHILSHLHSGHLMRFRNHLAPATIAKYPHPHARWQLWPIHCSGPSPASSDMICPAPVEALDQPKNR